MGFRRGFILFSLFVYLGCCDGGGCVCDPSKLWLDVYILFDQSTALSESKFSWMVTQVRYAFYGSTIGQELRQASRIGLIGYGDKVQELADLSTFQSFDQFYNLDVPYPGSECSDLKGAIDMARDGFERDHLNNRQKLLILASGGYRQCNFDAPDSSVTTFKANNGVLMVATFDDGADSNQLKRLASKNYYLNATHGIDPDQVHSMLCNANCFCPCLSNCQSSDDQWLAPGGDANNGCYMYETSGGIELLAKRDCLQDQGTLAMPKLSNDALSVLNGFKSVRDKQQGIWIGLENTGTVDEPKWTWCDGTLASPDITSQLDPKNGSCSTLVSSNGFLFSYNATNCQEIKCHSCYRDPCSSTNYCPPN